MKTYILYNPLAGDGNGAEASKALLSLYEGEVTQLDITKIDDYDALLSGLGAEDRIVVCGGDGTLNRFANAIEKIDVKCDIWYYALGTGNDFLHDLGKKEGEPPVLVNDYLKDLPVVEVGGERHRFINGIGFGIDGYCCEVGDRLKAESKKPNYTAIAIKGLLFHFKPTNATVIVDGQTYTYRKVWLAPTMKGRYYGGGMIATPDQDRAAPDGRLSVMVFHDSSSLKTLMIFPSIFKGEHIKSTRYVTVHTGYDIRVIFDSPRTVQIDGETIVGVTEYRAYAAHLAPETAEEGAEAEATV
jgi:diacylglycerol kinase family enzyme